MKTDNNTFDLPAFNYPRLVEQIEKLNRRAPKLGCQPIVLRVIREYEIERKNPNTNVKYMQARMEVEVIGQSPKFEGWSLLAAIEMQENGENLVRTVPGATVPESYRQTDTHCDHCKSSRRRKGVFILGHEDGRFAQVGRQCIADFLGNVSAETLVSRATWEFSALDAASEADADDFCHGGGGVWRRDITEFLATVAICVRRLGWVSRGLLEQRGDDTSLTTAYTAWAILTSSASYIRGFVEQHQLYAEERDETLAQEALAWAREIPTLGVSDYEYNLGVAARQKDVTHKTIGIVASAISAYQRHMEREDQLNIQRKKIVERKHVGDVGKRQDFANVTVKALKFFEGTYGVKTLVRFEDENSNILVWWASREQDIEEGDVCNIKGTVTKHSEYKGCPQTELKRVKIEKVNNDVPPQTGTEAKATDRTAHAEVRSDRSA